MVDVTDYSDAYSNGTRQSYFGAKPLSIGITQRSPERAMSSALCEEATERIADEQNRLNKKADAPRAHEGGMPEFVPTGEQRDCNRSPPAQAPLRFAVLAEASAVMTSTRRLRLSARSGLLHLP